MTKAKIETIAEKLGWTVTWDKNEDGTKFVMFSYIKHWRDLNEK